MAWAYSPSNINNTLQALSSLGKQPNAPPKSNKYGIQFGPAGSEYEFQQENLYGRYKDITDFNSPLYSQYRKFLSSATPQFGLNSLLAPLMAGNVDYGTAQKLGSQRVQEANVVRNEGINKGVQEFALGMQSQANPILGQMGGNYSNIMNYWENQRQFNAELDQRAKDRKAGFLNSLLGIPSGIAGYFTGGLLGGNNYDPYSGRAQQAGGG